jgi:hypothetical protein
MISVLTLSKLLLEAEWAKENIVFGELEKSLVSQAKNNFVRIMPGILGIIY